MEEKPVSMRTATMGRRPSYPMFVPFAIAFLTAALVTDALYWTTRDVFWARGSMWLTAAGLVATGVAFLAALIDFGAIRRVRGHYEGSLAIVGTLPVLGIALASLIIRIGNWEGAVLPAGVTLSAIGAGLMIVVGAVVSELEYRRMVARFVEETRRPEELRRAA